ncbi:MAG TPA: hypothetical protein VKU79_00025 [Thermoplasmataceae archaeon]|nr:hypothetical protein [Thermoplasmatales archaeon AK]HLH85240.1 hypothetical protein [Thermoplasmataceae archaeon]
MDSERVVYGSLGAGILATALGLVLFGWVPFFGWIIPGVIGGLAARGAFRGFFSSLIGGAVVSALIVAFALFVPVSEVHSIMLFLNNTYLNNNVFPSLLALMNMNTETLAKSVGIDSIILPAIGGFIGGAMLSRGYVVQEVPDEGGAAPAAAPSEPLDADSK